MKSATKVQLKRPFYPSKKRKTTTIHAKISGRYERKRKCSFRDHFTPAKKDEDCKTRLDFREGTCNDKRKGGRSFRDHFTPAEKRRRRYYMLRIQRSHERQGGCSFRDPFSPTQKNEDDANLRLDYGRILNSAGVRFKRKKIPTSTIDVTLLCPVYLFKCTSSQPWFLVFWTWKYRHTLYSY